MHIAWVTSTLMPCAKFCCFYSFRIRCLSLFSLNHTCFTSPCLFLLRGSQCNGGDHRTLFGRVYSIPTHVPLRRWTQLVPSSNSFHINDVKYWISLDDFHRRLTLPHLLFFDDCNIGPLDSGSAIAAALSRVRST